VRADRPEIVVQTALRANPFTAPYPIAAAWKNGTLILSGRVGTKQVHDAAVRVVIAHGYPLRDDLVIDTAETLRVPMSSPPWMSAYGALTPDLAATYYVYPPPLFGRLDDPFFGMVPPLVSFPPWWRRRAEAPPLGPDPSAGPAARNPAAGPVVDRSVPGSASAAAPDAGNVPPIKGELEITVDATGQVFLRGVVASEEVAREIEQTAWSVPGVTRVVTQFQVQPRRADGPPPPPEPVVAPDRAERPPATPEPVAFPPPVQPRRFPEPASRSNQPDSTGATPEHPQASPAPAAGRTVPRALAIAVAALDSQRLTRRVVDSVQRRESLAGLPVKVRSTGDSVMLSGRVPSAYEAMLVYRAAQQTPGVREVVDHLEFLVPDEDHPNPLVQKGRPQDLEPYLTAQMSRHVGDLAHIDVVKAHGDILEVRGTLLDARDRDRVLAIIRSIPVLHGFKLNPMFTAE
jgi:osmotically-inducible protein OsmY